MKQFEVGKTYSMRSVCDSNCIWSYEVVARTACTVTLKDEDGEIKKCRVSKKASAYANAETVLPEGSYSMCPMLRADS